MSDAALEVLRVGQHRDGGGAIISVDVSQANRVEVVAEDPSGRGGFLDLSDDAHPAAHQRSGEVKRGGSRVDTVLKLRYRDLHLEALDLLQLGLHDLPEDVRRA